MCAHFPIEMPNTKSENFTALPCCYLMLGLGCNIYLHIGGSDVTYLIYEPQHFALVLAIIVIVIANGHRDNRINGTNIKESNKNKTDFGYI